MRKEKMDWAEVIALTLSAILVGSLLIAMVLGFIQAFAGK